LTKPAAPGSGAQEPYQVFISHSSDDRTDAVRLCELLEGRGIRCWIAPRDVTPGDTYGSQIVRALTEVEALIFLLSKSSTESRHVSSEVARAFEKGKDIYPVRLAEVWPSDEFELFVTSAHWVEAWQKGLEAAADELAVAIREKPTKKPPPPAPPGVAPGGPRTSCLVGLLILLAAVLAVGIPFWLVLRDAERGARFRERLPPALQKLFAQPDPAPPTPTIRPPEPPKPEVREPPFGGRILQVLDPPMEFQWIEALGSWVGKYEVTNEQFKRFREDHWSGRFQGEALDDDAQPVVKISQPDAVAFSRWLTRREIEAGRLRTGWRYRLPLEREWMIFAQCGDDREFPWGAQWPPSRGNYADKTLGSRTWADEHIREYDDGYRVSCAVHHSGKNDWGLYGVGGNVWEWMQEFAGGKAVVRGGAWNRAAPEHLACRVRVTFEPTDKDPTIGFRLVLAPAKGDARPRPPRRP